jgi:hypothetical protein
MSSERNIKLDVMRLVGVFIIIIAHSSPPWWLFQLRNFGTPLLIVASALTYSVIYSTRHLDLLPFYKKRLSRLIFPAWTFLSIFFCTAYLLSLLLSKNYPFSIQQIITSYSFYSGIGFVWILKVYIILALLTPVALALNRRIQSNRTYFTLLITGYLLYEAGVYTLSPVLPPQSLEFFNTVVFTTIPYSLLYFYGFRLSTLSNIQVSLVTFASLSLFGFLALLKYMDAGQIVLTQGYKYPPTAYYLSYAFFALNSVYLFLKALPTENVSLVKMVTWLSSNSLWIYLWHIMAYYAWDFLVKTDNVSMILFIAKAVFLLAFGVVFTITQKRIVERYVPVGRPWGKTVSSLLT